MDVLKRIELAPGASVTLPNVTLEVQLPNSYDMRAMDFGFSLTFAATDGGTTPGPGESPGPTVPPGPGESPGPTVPPGPDASPEPSVPADSPEPAIPSPDPDNPGGPDGHGDVPKTGDDTALFLWIAVLAAAVVLLIIVLRRMKNGQDKP